MDIKSTLNLPQTDFPMKGNLPQKEPGLIEDWQSTKVYKFMVERNKGQKKFVMPDGPPYANGNIHVGHVLNKVLKDIIVKYKNMKGFHAAFVPGWDCHGLPIELNVTKKFKNKELSKEKIRSLCREEAKKWIQKQMKQFIRLGILADWDSPYLTLHPEYEAEEVRVFSRIFENGILYYGEKPVYWCPLLQTALAAAEVEYLDYKSLSVFVKFQVTGAADLKTLGSSAAPCSFVIWTTTPWTLPANYAIALNKNFDYGLYCLHGADKRDCDNPRSVEENIIVACELKDFFEKTCQVTLSEIQRFKGADLEGLKACHPFMDRGSQVVLSDHVTLDAGTGCVHVAPGHGMDDYYIGQKYTLPVCSPVDKAGCYTSEVPQYEGEKIWEVNPKIVEALRYSGHLLGVNELIHSYPHNPRTKTPLIFRATPQWFIRMDDPQYPLRDKALSASHSQIDFFPAWGQQRLQSMLSHSPDWCVSRQRVWGVPLPVFHCQNCETPLVHSEVMNRVANKMESTGQGIEAFFSTNPREFTEGHMCSQCQTEDFVPSSDILDVWFDSGVCHSAVQKKREDLDFPADIYVEGSDQHRGWFQTSLISSLAAYDEPPFKALVTHGFVNDSQGHKMSKSQGNVVEPMAVIKKKGAEILRLWVAYEDYGQDVNASDEIFQRIIETYRRIRNTMRFLLGNVADFHPCEDSVEWAHLPPMDQWVLIRLNGLIEKVTEAYDSYHAHRVYHAVNHFYTVDLSATYLDILKDRLYTWKKTGHHRRSSQTVLYQLLKTLNTMMAPILSFLSEEVHRYIPGLTTPSVFLENFPEVCKEWNNEVVQRRMDQVMEVRAIVSRALEPMRKNKEIGSSLDAMVAIYAPPPILENLRALQQAGEGPDYLREILIVSQVDLYEGSEIYVEVHPATGDKCPRCWHYTTEPRIISKYSNSPLCSKCVEALIE